MAKKKAAPKEPEKGELTGEDKDRLRRFYDLYDYAAAHPLVKGLDLSLTFASISSLVAPATKALGTLNTIGPPWVRVRVVNDRGKPLPKEPCRLYLYDGRWFGGVTNDDGVVTFNLPIDFDLHLDGKPRLPAFQLHKILEDWSLDPNGVHKEVTYPGPAGSDKKMADGTLHIVTLHDDSGCEVRVDKLTTEQKLQHFRDAYVPAVYVPAGSDKTYKSGFSSERLRWEWGKGSVCNQHVNFFLGYFFNYNAEFTGSGSQTDMACLPAYSTALHTFGKVKHRSYKELLSMIAGFGALPHGPQVDKKGKPKPLTEAGHNSAHYYFEYIRIGRYFGRDGKPTARGARLVEALGEINVYSVSDFVKEKYTKNGRAVFKTWLKKNKADPAARIGKLVDLPFVKKWLKAHAKLPAKQLALPDSAALRAWLKQEKVAEPAQIDALDDAAALDAWPATVSDAEIEAFTDNDLWPMAWKLDEDIPLQDSAVAKIRGTLCGDHHAGVLLKRAVGGGPPGPTGPYELYQFAANGSKNNAGVYSKGAIKVEKFSSAGSAFSPSHFYHLAIWKLLPLRAGGFGPLDAEANEGQISIDVPPRLFQWK